MSVESSDHFSVGAGFDPIGGLMPVEVEFDYILRRLGQECAAAFNARHRAAHYAHLIMAKGYADRASILARFAAGRSPFGGDRRSSMVMKSEAHERAE
jgi:hypothetical protein